MIKKLFSNELKSRTITYLVLILLVVIEAIFSYTGNLTNLIKSILVPLTCYMVAALSLNLVVGISGELSLGQAGFMSIGAFSAIIFAGSLETIITNLIELGLNKEAGELYEKLGQHQSAVDAFRKVKCFQEAIKIAKNNNLNIINQLEEEYGEFLYEQKEYENAISHFIEAGVKEKAMKVLIHIKGFYKYQCYIMPCYHEV